MERTRRRHRRPCCGARPSWDCSVVVCVCVWGVFLLACVVFPGVRVLI